MSNIEMPNDGNKLVVILGTAHLSSTPGKRSADGSFREYEYSRLLCQVVKNRLVEKGISCTIDYPDADMKGCNSSQELVNRCKIVNDLCRQFQSKRSVIYVSLHVNAANASGARGFQTHVCNNASVRSERLARSIWDAAIKHKLQGNRWRPNEGMIKSNFYVLQHTICPATLCEVGFMTNKDDLALMRSQEGLDSIADSIVEGIEEYIKIA